jgi:hypothetical protein
LPLQEVVVQPDQWGNATNSAMSRVNGILGPNVVQSSERARLDLESYTRWVE